MKKYIIAAALVLAASRAEAQQLVVEWTPGICEGFCSPTVGYNVYVDATKVDVAAGTPSGAELKATIDLGVVPTTDIHVSMTSYDSLFAESAKSNAVTIAAQEWLRGTPVPLVVRVRPIVTR